MSKCLEHLVSYMGVAAECQIAGWKHLVQSSQALERLRVAEK